MLMDDVYPKECAMKRIGLVLILIAVLLGSLSGCIFNRPLDACFVVVDDPDGDPMTRLFSAACSTHFEESLYPVMIYTLTWYFGDGHKRTVPGNLLTTYTYLETGIYTVELLLVGPDGETARATRQLIIGE
jgi:PKD domain